MAQNDRAKNTLKTATIIRNLGPNPQSFIDSVGKADRDDLYSIKLDSRSTLNLNAIGLGNRSKIGLQVFGLKGAKNQVLKVIGRTLFSDLDRKQTKKYINVLGAGSIGRTKTMSLTLDAGTYYLRVYRSQGKNRYRLSSSLGSSSSLPNLSSNDLGSTISFPSQTWIRQFGSSDNDYAFGTAIDSTGDLYVAGVRTASGAFSGSSLIAKYKQDGSLDWQRPLSISGATTAADIEVDTAGNYYVVGATVNGLNSDAFVAKYNSAGDQQWIKTIATTILGFNAIDAASGVFLDGNDIYVTGIRRGAPAFFGQTSQGQAFIAKYDSSGNLANGFGTNGIVDFGSSGTTAASGITVASNTVYIAGITASTLSTLGGNDFKLAEGDAFVASFDRTTGNALWNQTLSSGSGTDYARGIAIKGSELYIAGQTAGALPSGSLPANTYAGGESDAFIAKYSLTNNSGALQWTKQFGGSGLDAAQALTIDPGGKLYLTGETNTSLFGTAVGGSDAWIAQVDSSGNLVSTTQLGTSQNDEAYGIITDDSSSALYVIGQTQGTFAAANSQNQGNYDIWLTRYS